MAVIDLQHAAAAAVAAQRQQQWQQQQQWPTMNFKKTPLSTTWERLSINSNGSTIGSPLQQYKGDGEDGAGRLERAGALVPWWRRCRRWTRIGLVAAATLLILGLVVVLPVCLVMLRHPHQTSNPRQPHPPKGDTIVKLGYASYAGTSLPNGVNQFLGMRYAAPPVGNLRWRAPVQPPMTETLQQATQFKPICLGIGFKPPFASQSEDCLYANVWSPANATTTSKLPVWLFIQGGGYTINANANWNGAEVVAKSGHNIVMVNFNYRVGMWGFLASEKVRANGDLNVGLLDQRMLMMWVKENIAKFGGDPHHVVIHGASAGAGSVALHLVAYGGRNDKLFVGGIAESIFYPAQPTVSELEWQFDRLAKQIGCDSASDPMVCLRQKKMVDLQAVNVASEFPGRTSAPLPLFYWTPCVDGDFLPASPYTLYQQGQVIHVPVIIGTTTDEGSIFADNAATADDMNTFLGNNYPGLTSKDLSDIGEKYPLQPALPDHAAWFPSTERAYGEATFICPATNTLNALQTAQNTQLWSYRYNVQDEENTAEGLGVLHLFSSAAVFGPDNVGGARQSYRSYNAPIVPVVMNYWISFVRTLDPNAHSSADAPVWEGWTSDKGASRLVIETGRSRMETTDQEEVSRCEFWMSVLGGRMEQR